ncbi:hypothetical protein GCM10009839_24210 [Catenulispora yoronensis]|uniref:Peptidase A2 domain-containing protein n=1 Tax=Catenulispora yoronensis TaxID=450799 RepID=A0ABP5FEY2_9ACTN
MATRITATAAAIGLAGAALTLQPAARAARADAVPAVPGGSIPFSVADPATAPRPVVTVAIGGVSLLLLLDTGSTGIRVSGSKVPAGAVTVTGRAAPYGYGSGVQLHGDQADADVAIGGYHTGPLPIELVRSTDCFADKPRCPAADGAKPTMFGGLLDGVMGVSLEGATGLVNPMWTLQDAAGNHVGRQFAVRFSPDQYSGSILLGVPAAGYRLVQAGRTPTLKAKRGSAAGPEAGDARTAAARYASWAGSYDARPQARGRLGARPPQRPLPAADPALAPAPPSWNPRTVQTCLTAVGLPRTCAPAMFDSGTPNFALDVPNVPAGTWRAGRALEIGVPQAGWDATFVTGPGNAVTVTNAPSTEISGSLIGLPAFAKGPLRFDLLAGTVGFPVSGAGAASQTSRSLLAPQRALVKDAPVKDAPPPAIAPPPPLAPVAQVAPMAPPPAVAPAASNAAKPVLQAAPQAALQAASQAAPQAASQAAPHAAPHAAPPKHPAAKPHARIPFHQSGKKALPDTGVPLSAALGAVTALTALLAGIGTVLAARRRTDRGA